MFCTKFDLEFVLIPWPNSSTLSSRLQATIAYQLRMLQSSPFLHLLPCVLRGHDCQCSLWDVGVKSGDSTGIDNANTLVAFLSSMCKDDAMKTSFGVILSTTFVHHLLMSVVDHHSDLMRKLRVIRGGNKNKLLQDWQIVMPASQD